MAIAGSIEVPLVTSGAIRRFHLHRDDNPYRDLLGVCVSDNLIPPHMNGLTGQQDGIAPNRKGAARIHPCPEDNRPDIVEAFQHFGMLPAGFRLPARH